MNCKYFLNKMKILFLKCDFSLPLNLRVLEWFHLRCRLDGAHMW